MFLLPTRALQAAMALALSPPSGESRGPELIRVAVAMNALAILVVILRFFTRGYIVRTFGLDDFFIAIATMLGAAMTAMTILQVESGQGRHVLELTDDQMMRSMLFMWIDMLIYFLANWAVKMSILALYHRISHGTKGLPLIMNARLIYVIAGFISIFTVGIMFATVLSCDPVAMPWDTESAPTGCHSIREFNISQGSINVFTDFVLLLLPIPLVLALQIDRKQRAALILIFGIGVVPLIASIRRLCELSMPNEKGSWLTADMTWYVM
ncbi:hypothetical protein P154DRAFT_164587 [Amniculicola lignicola CBS 123094]|uniref:Rhodopsin domain-containing protein n=1 Tax=Amniculicola lignicola CBS 123094 TaxID=1392246 RepID=A0A6A5WR35_9PLEO|nr:hypothetical protein P154DRAFT_164587 [Amniculicola lignicola CBS 123094]